MCFFFKKKICFYRYFPSSPRPQRLINGKLRRSAIYTQRHSKRHHHQTSNDNSLTHHTLDYFVAHTDPIPIHSHHSHENHLTDKTSQQQKVLVIRVSYFLHTCSTRIKLPCIVHFLCFCFFFSLVYLRFVHRKPPRRIRQNFHFVLLFAPDGLLYIQMAQKPTKPNTVAAMPESQGQAPEMA